MNTEEEMIIDRVRKLLRLAQSANPHEAGLALERALRLAAKHKIDVAGLELDPGVERIVHERFPIGARLSYISKLALSVVRDFFHVDVVLDKPQVIFAGTATDIVIAHYGLGFLTGACARALRHFEQEKQRRPSLTRRQNFIAGYIYGIRNQLRGTQETCELENAKAALAIADQKRRRQAYVDALVGQTKSIDIAKPRRMQGAVIAGFIEGRATWIRTPLNPAPETLRLQ